MIIRLLKVSSPLYTPQPTQCPERIRYEKNISHSFKTLFWKKLMRKQSEGETSSLFSSKSSSFLFLHNKFKSIYYKYTVVPPLIFCSFQVKPSTLFVQSLQEEVSRDHLILNCDIIHSSLWHHFSPVPTAQHAWICHW